MCIKSKIRIILSLTLAVWFLCGTNIYALTLEQSRELTVQATENTIVTIDEDSLRLLYEKNISIDEFE